jgi:hypothetical protein
VPRLEDWINDFNVEATAISDGQALGYYVKGERGSTIGGLYGWTWGGVCHVRYSTFPRS